MQPGDTLNQSQPGRVVRHTVWAVLGVLVVMTIGGKAFLDRDWQSRVAAYQALNKKESEDSEALLNTIPRRASVGQVEVILNTHLELRHVGSPGGAEAMLGKYETFDVILHFDNADPPRYRFPNWRRLPRNLERLPIEEAAGDLARAAVPVSGGMFVPVFYVLWLPLWVWARFDKPRRAWLMLAATCVFVAAGAAILAAPSHTLTVKGVMSNDRLFWVVIAAVVTGGAYAVDAMIARQRDPLACEACGYNLYGCTSKSCPECGQEIPHLTRAQINVIRAAETGSRDS